MGWVARTGITVGIVVVLAGGYLTADAYDVVPGVLTTAPAVAPAAPFPVPPGAVDSGSPAQTLPALDESAPLPDAAAISASLDALVKDTRLGGRVGGVVLDRITGEVLAQSGADTLMVPASTQKILTAAAALASPGPEVTLTTKVVEVDAGTIALVGGGDMMLAAQAGDPLAVNGRAGMADLAAQVADKLKVTGRTTVRLVVDDRYFSGPTVSPSVFPGNVAAGYVAPVTSVAVDIARLSDAEYAKRSPDPSVAAAQVLAQRLTEQGITIDGAPVRGESASAAKVLGSVESAPLGEVVAYFLQHSDNTITEVVGRVVAIDAGLPATFDGATQAVGASVSRLGVDLTGAVLADCSGLGDGSAVSAAQLAAVVDLLADPAQPGLRAGAVGLPVAGLSGTLDDRYLASPGRGVVRAKTGSLPNVTSLAGTVVTAQDRQLVFVVLADALPPGGGYGARQLMDGFVGSLVGSAG
ncbi:D-alanyl-D-alanine carboxypeptidase/D-alanyl-D-alanine-endopeptidase [Oerskovia jenensis]|uniref:D-alanyl-D-alanine carboxypeptidase/D-alanyl-D-alanine-endopeptidase (Penicillin-binding protein 4) n=1 Tax=Oerskovia jenensis TaxID=162169 RepID=A0ABS2LII1_9CELL|nr:D-alanyl-D-alanine carboxypeptidase/D-alanyl-D-alanine-endopeptidase [Oerskovia jenensis]MBM7479944.1 D-alanyl-D-alanine carboxypeptidase/D-alanyl-D-alanine-endopeptidase (penicillin-binding protein 4) [Oerskovia jenensis]